MVEMCKHMNTLCAKKLPFAGNSIRVEDAFNTSKQTDWVANSVTRTQETERVTKFVTKTQVLQSFQVTSPSILSSLLGSVSFDSVCCTWDNTLRAPHKAFKIY